MTRMTKTSEASFRAQLARSSLTTAEILYEMPDIKGLFQLFIYQCMDLAPKFPTLHKFLDFWQRNLDGKLYRVTIAHHKLIGPTELKLLTADYRLN